jgi:hypothetical protein
LEVVGGDTRLLVDGGGNEIVTVATLQNVINLTLSDLNTPHPAGV